MSLCDPASLPVRLYGRLVNERARARMHAARQKQSSASSEVHVGFSDLEGFGKEPGRRVRVAPFLTGLKSNLL